MLGYKFKIVENTKTSLSSILSNKNLWKKELFPLQATVRKERTMLSREYPVHREENNQKLNTFQKYYRENHKVMLVFTVFNLGRISRKPVVAGVSKSQQQQLG